MKIGTKSLLFGVHQFLWHPWTVARAWRKLYGRWPTWQEAVCIFSHDLGYWGKPNMDGPEGREHPWLGAAIAGEVVQWISRRILREDEMTSSLRGIESYTLTLYHSRHFAKQQGEKPSQLCWADKFCIWTEPKWFYWLRATLSGELKEYRKNHEVRTGKISSRQWIEYYRQCVYHYEEISDLIESATYKHIPGSLNR